MSRQLVAELGRLAHTHGVPACVHALHQLVWASHAQGCFQMRNLGGVSYGELGGGVASAIAEDWSERLGQCANHLRDRRRTILRGANIERPDGGTGIVVNEYYGCEDYGSISQHAVVFTEQGLRARVGNAVDLLRGVRALYGMPVRGLTPAAQTQVASPT